ncbi:MAG TPA: T9SS type A sorting domain-containing protein [Bacteroidia bacterium]|jgi:hypothetical protein
MKKLLTLFSMLMLMNTIATAQCTSSATTYDLTVSGNVVIGPAGPSFTFAIICAGGRLMDSANCCTRLVHVEPGGIYEAGPNAYAFVYVKSGGTFDAHGNNMFFGVSYEAGAVILNYAGPMTLCTAVVFPSGSCTATGIANQETASSVKSYPNPCNEVLYLENTFSKAAMITVYDIAGKNVMEASEITNEINVSMLAPGMYTFTISTEGHQINYGKFAIVR